ncbi:hypothetical protein ACFU93_32460 [Streptomyces sp. NPDC057611]|uniref:hypothetical protein n=1 Tax=Streptomyces sp. NPDC057611 TaxID=3346182 RepID=UPI003690B12C
MFTEKITSESGSESRGTATEVHALSLLRRSYNRGYAITATREGGALIRWRKVNPAASGALRSISLRPHTEVGELSEETRRNLAVIDSVRVARYARSIEAPAAGSSRPERTRSRSRRPTCSPRTAWSSPTEPADCA